jgi:predicted AlkP superfamily phosphohydrolase/phosphomutase
MTKHVFVLGLDGADFDTVGAHLQSGRMPHLASIIQGGASASLPSTVFPITPSAWSAALSGLNPGKTGVLTFERRTESYRTRLASAADLGERTLLSWLPRFGLPTISIGFPMTTPPPPGAGIVVAGWDASPGAPVCNVEQWAGVAGDLGYRLDDEFSVDPDTLAAHVRGAFRLTARLAESEPWNCLMLYLGFIDSLGHRFGNGNDLTHRLLDVADDELGRLVETFAAQTQCLACSDHGFGTFGRSFSALQWLETRGYLTFRSRTLRGSRSGAVPGVEIMDLDSGLVDWPHTRAFCYEAVGPVLGIRLNLRGSYPAGCVEPSDAWALADEIRSRLIAERDPDDGSALVSAVVRREEVFWGPHVHEFPELIVTTVPDTLAYVAKRSATDDGFKLEPGFVHRGAFDSHRPDGIWMSSFPITGAPRVEDVAPTICALLGIPPPADADGINRASTAVLPAADAVHAGPATAAHATVPASPYTPEEEEIVRKRLEALGYL